MRGELDWIVMKALEKDRTRRYETASGLARRAAVPGRRAGAGLPAVGRLSAAEVRAAEQRTGGAGWCWPALVLGTVGTSIGLVWALRAEREATSCRHERATGAETKAKEEAAIAKAVKDFLQDDLLGQADPDRTLGPRR